MRIRPFASLCLHIFFAETSSGALRPLCAYLFALLTALPPPSIPGAISVAGCDLTATINEYVQKALSPQFTRAMASLRTFDVVRTLVHRSAQTSVTVVDSRRRSEFDSSSDAADVRRGLPCYASEPAIHALRNSLDFAALLREKRSLLGRLGEHFQRCAWEVNGAESPDQERRVQAIERLVSLLGSFDPLSERRKPTAVELFLRRGEVPDFVSFGLCTRLGDGAVTACTVVPFRLAGERGFHVVADDWTLDVRSPNFHPIEAPEPFQVAVDGAPFARIDLRSGRQQRLPDEPWAADPAALLAPDDLTLADALLSAPFLRPKDAVDLLRVLKAQRFLGGYIRAKVAQFIWELDQGEPREWPELLGRAVAVISDPWVRELTDDVDAGKVSRVFLNLQRLDERARYVIRRIVRVLQRMNFSDADQVTFLAVLLFRSIFYNRLVGTTQEQLKHMLRTIERAVIEKPEQSRTRVKISAFIADLQERRPTLAPATEPVGDFVTRMFSSYPLLPQIWGHLPTPYHHRSPLFFPLCLEIGTRSAADAPTAPWTGYKAVRTVDTTATGTARTGEFAGTSFRSYSRVPDDEFTAISRVEFDSGGSDDGDESVVGSDTYHDYTRTGHTQDSEILDSELNFANRTATGTGRDAAAPLSSEAGSGSEYTQDEVSYDDNSTLTNTEGTDGGESNEYD
jgi:hypothetical protein